MSMLINWFTLGFILIILEMLLPGMFLMWFGVSALIVGTIVWIIPMSMNAELILFAITSIASVIIVILIMRRVAPNSHSTVTQNLNQARGAELIGAVFTLDSSVTHNEGKLNIGDSVWLIRGPNAASGTHIIITNIENNTLIYQLTEQ